MNEKIRAVVLTALLVAAALPAGVVSAQSSNVYAQTFSDNPEHVLVNQANITGEFTVEVSTTDAQGIEGTKKVLARERLGSGTEKWIQFNNEAAHSNVTLKVTVHGSGTPTFGSGTDKGLDLAYFVGGTGGDRDLVCDSGEQINQLTNPFVHIVDCGALPGTTDVNTTGTDAEQTHIDILQSAQNQQAAAENYGTTLDNRLNDAKTVARIKGKNAYIRALNNGSSESSARTAAKNAVADHYATMQVNLKAEWNLQLYNAWYLQGVAANESGLSASVIQLHNDDGSAVNVESASAESLTLVNGTTVQSERVHINGGGYNTNWDQNAGLTDGTQTHSFDGFTMYGRGINVTAPNSNYADTPVLNFQQYADRWTLIQNQNSAVQGEMDTVVDNTYTAYQNGEINNSDLVDPYVLSSEYSPGTEYQGWAAAQLTLLGQNNPDAMDQIGRFNVTVESGTQYQGVLFSQENPTDAQGNAVPFEANATYNPANVAGTQYVVTDQSTHELTTNFTIDSITTHDGERRQNVTIVEKQYQTTNVSELKELYDDLAEYRAMVEAREQNLGGGAGGGVFAGSGGLLAGVLLAAGAYLALREDDNGGGRY